MPQGSREADPLWGGHPPQEKKQPNRPNWALRVTNTAHFVKKCNADITPPARNGGEP